MSLVHESFLGISFLVCIASYAHYVQQSGLGVSTLVLRMEINYHIPGLPYLTRCGHLHQVPDRLYPLLRV